MTLGSFRPQVARWRLSYIWMVQKYIFWCDLVWFKWRHISEYSLFLYTARISQIRLDAILQSCVDSHRNCWQSGGHHYSTESFVWLGFIHEIHPHCIGSVRCFGPLHKSDVQFLSDVIQHLCFHVVHIFLQNNLFPDLRLSSFSIVDVGSFDEPYLSRSHSDVDNCVVRNEQSSPGWWSLHRSSRSTHTSFSDSAFLKIKRVVLKVQYGRISTYPISTGSTPSWQTLFLSVSFSWGISSLLVH